MDAPREPTLMTSTPSLLARLDGLPLRPATARWVVDRALAGLGGREARGVDFAEPDATGVPRLALDPAWALARWTGRLDQIGPLGLVEQSAWWRPTGTNQADALASLWRRGVAAGWVARRMALEQGRDDADELASIALLHELPLWAMAALGKTPDRPIARKTRVRAGRVLAERWRLPVLLADVLAFAGGPVPPGVGHDPDGLRLVLAAVSWSRRTPWAEAVPETARTSDGRRERLTVAAQLLTREGFAPVGIDAAEETRTRQLAGRLAAREARDEEMARMRRALRVIAGPPGPGPKARRDLPTAAIESHRRLRDEVRHRADDVDAAVHSYRDARRDEPKRRLDALAEFAAGAAHELNNPLAVMLGRAQLLLGRFGSDPEVARSLRAIMTQAQRAHRMLRDLMYVARPPAPRSRPVAVPDFLRVTLDDLKALAVARRVVMTVSLPPSGPPIELDPDAFRHLVETLVTNAIEATPPDGTVGVHLERGGDRLRLRVEDSGPPLGPVAAEHMMNPFFCGRQAGRGLGLGLSRVSRALEGGGGRLRWHRKPGGGLVFVASVPASPLGRIVPVASSPTELSARASDEERAA
jgi:signal transduction histidine kinase